MDKCKFREILLSKKFSIHPVALLTWIWLFVVVGVKSAIAYFFAVLIHESAHVFVAKKLGYQLMRFSICPYGFSLDYHGQDIDFKDETKIAFAGPFANLLSSFFIVAIWWFAPATYYFTQEFVEVSVMLALLNLLPAYPLDGGRIFVAVASHFIKKPKKIAVMFNVLLCLLFFVMFLVSIFVNFNPSLLLFTVFLAGGVLEISCGTKLEKINIFCKKPKKFVKVQGVVVTEQTTLGEVLKKMQTSRTQIFCLVCENGRIINISEQMIVNFALNFELTKNFAEILRLYK